jgi:antibiotic biosynthesis monooxygenase (ABM) superfamily enzyme
MNRRDCFKVIGTAAAAMSLQAAGAAQPIVLELDLEVDPAKEKDMLANYRTKFRPAIRKQPGFVDVKLMKLQTALAGKAPANCTYRLLISFQTEDQRKAWVATATHQQVWPTIEGQLKGAKYIALLYDVVS